jgi:hypothetical protein
MSKDTKTLVYKKGDRTAEAACIDFQEEMDKITPHLDAAIKKMEKMYPGVRPKYSIDNVDGTWLVAMVFTKSEFQD